MPKLRLDDMTKRGETLEMISQSRIGKINYGRERKDKLTYKEIARSAGFKTGYPLRLQMQKFECLTMKSYIALVNATGMTDREIISVIRGE